MYKNCNRIDKHKIKRIGVKPGNQLFEYNGFLSKNHNTKALEQRRSTVFEKVKEISGLDTSDETLNGKPIFYQYLKINDFHILRCSLAGRCIQTTNSTGIFGLQPHFLVDTFISKPVSHQLLEDGYKQFDWAKLKNDCQVDYFYFYVT